MYKFLLNALPLLIPAIRPSRPRAASTFAEDDDEDDIALESQSKPAHYAYASYGPTASHPSNTLIVPLSERRARLSLSAHAQLLLVRKRTRRWHAALAGAVAGGLAVMWETRGRRVTIAQQLFVRWALLRIGLLWIAGSALTRPHLRNSSEACRGRTTHFPPGKISEFRMETCWCFHWRT